MMIEDGTLIINSFEIDDMFKSAYNFCLTSSECFASYEYIAPSYTSNYDKVLIKLVGKVNLIKSNMNINNLYDFVDKFGTIIYEKNGKTKTHGLSLIQALPTKSVPQNTYYIEVLDEVKDAEHVSIQFKIRNNIYLYNLK